MEGWRTCAAFAPSKAVCKQIGLVQQLVLIDTVVCVDSILSPFPARSTEKTSFRETRCSFTGEAHFEEYKEIIKGTVREEIV